MFLAEIKVYAQRPDITVGSLGPMSCQSEVAQKTL
jgi:hypothetical protein